MDWNGEGDIYLSTSVGLHSPHLASSFNFCAWALGLSQFFGETREERWSLILVGTRMADCNTHFPHLAVPFASNYPMKVSRFSPYLLSWLTVSWQVIRADGVYSTIQRYIQLSSGILDAHPEYVALPAKKLWRARPFRTSLIMNKKTNCWLWRSITTPGRIGAQVR